MKDQAAHGTFTGALTGTKLTWKLTFAKLTGPATAAHIHLGGMGKAGNVVVAICGPCTIRDERHRDDPRVAAEHDQEARHVRERAHREEPERRDPRAARRKSRDVADDGESVPLGYGHA